MITLKPTVRYWIMTNLIWGIFISLLFFAVVFFRFEWYLNYLLGVVTMLLVMISGWHYVVLRNITYIIDIEQIVVKQGVFNRTIDYMELYRVFDYQKRQNLVEVFLGIMNVVILSRDITKSKLVLIGIQNSNDVIPLIRDRVEIQKQKKGILEFNNPYSRVF